MGACTFIIAVCSTPLPNAAFGSSFSTRRSTPAISAPKRGGAPRTSSTRCVGAVRLRSCSWRRLVGGSGWGWCAFGLLCLFATLCFVCLLGLLCACFRLSLPLLGFFTLLQLAPCFGSCLASRGQPLCPWDWGDKVVSSCWWVRACFIHPETLFQTLSHTPSNCWFPQRRSARKRL